MLSVMWQWCCVVALGLVVPACVMGCECSESSQREAFGHAEAVFVGRVARIDHLRLVSEGPGRSRIELEESPPTRNDHTLVWIDARRQWKGNVSGRVAVYAVARPSMCDGYGFEEGKEYVVYTRVLGPEWDALNKFAGGRVVYEIGPCPLRVIKDDVRREVRVLGRGRVVKGR